MKQTQIMVIDDHKLFLKGIYHLLKEMSEEFDIHTYSSIKELTRDKERLSHSQLLISDIDIPGEDIFELFKYVKNNYPELPVLVISMHKKLAVIRKCKALGVEGYILKDEDEHLHKAIEQLLIGHSFYSPQVEIFYNRATNHYDSLSTREEDILKLIAQGYGNVEIADNFSIAIETVKTHKKNIKLKLGLKDMHDIIQYAKTNYLI